MTESSKTTDQSQQSSTKPWEAAMPLVNSLLSKYSGANTDVTNPQSSAVQSLLSATGGLSNFAPQATNAINTIFGTDNSPQVGMLTDAYSAVKRNLSPTAAGENLNPYSTPGFSDAINTAISDATKATKGVYAGSGRDPSGAGSFAGSLARGITQGVAPTIANQYNQNYSNMVGANNSLLTGAGTTASGINTLNNSRVGALLSGIQGASAIPGLATAPGMAQLGAANTAYGLPFANLAQLLQPSIALAGLGSQSSGTSHGEQTSTPSLMDSMSSGMNLFGKGLSGASALMMLSDERAKTDIVKVGKLNDGQNVYSYRYRGSPRTEIGLMAQEVERRDPGAVREIRGLKHVDYGRALAPAARVGALAEAA